MKKQSYLIYIILLFLTLTTAGCNNDIFITPMKVSAERVELGPDRPTASVHIDGDWHFKGAEYTGDNEYQWAYADKDECRFETPFLDFTIKIHEHDIDMTLETYLGSAPGEINIYVANEFDDKIITATIEPTGEFKIDIKDISYTLDRWSGYPDQDKTYAILVVSFPEGPEEDMWYSFPAPKAMPVLYWFESWDGGSVFADRVLSSGHMVPVPSYSKTEYYFDWELLGDEVPLSMRRKDFNTTHYPALPEPLFLEAGVPVKLYLRCDYESLGFNGTIKAENCHTGEIKDIDFVLHMLMPMKFHATVEPI